MGAGLYRLGFEVCELFGSATAPGATCLTGPTGYPASHDEWGRLRAALDAFYDALTPGQLADLRSAIAAARLGHEQEQRRELRAAEGEKARKARAGFVYLLAGQSGHFKIGWAKEVTSRVCQLDTQAPYLVSLVHCFPADDARAVERELHARFRAKRVKGEWFALAEAEVEWFKEVRRWPTR